MIGFKAGRSDFMAFGWSAVDPAEDRYLDQMKILTHVAVTSVFDIEQDELPKDQSVTIEEAVIGFVAAQCNKWNEPGKPFSSRLSGSAGGDGEYAKEALAFGLHVEKSHPGAICIWSRPWLVLK